MAWMKAVFYRNVDGREPVRDSLATLPAAARAAVLLQLDRLNTLSTTDPPLPFPHSSQVAGELRELRCHYGRRLFRILYRRSETLFVLLHAFEKTTTAVPDAETALAQLRWEDFQRRMNEFPRRPPRAAGHDAP
jgi:phage-related protein